MQTLATQRLVLRPFIESDAQALLDYLKEPIVHCFASEKIATLEEAKQKIIEKNHKPGHLAIALNDSDFVIGELFYEFEEPDTYSVGWNFNPNYAKKGYAFESAQALFSELFRTNARRVYAYIEDNNFSSQKLAERLGMRQEGLFLEFISFVKDETGLPLYENTYQYALLKHEWQKQQLD